MTSEAGASSAEHARVVLASASPRRRELLAHLDVSFEVVPANLDEEPRSGEAPRDLAARLAREKAGHVAATIGDDVVVVAADTVVAHRRQLFGKPVDADDARAMLRTLSGRSHSVITGIAVARASTVLVEALTTRVRLRAMREDEIDAYVASGDPLDKAGAYAVQNEVVRPVERLSGCRCNVVGFPVGLATQLLRQLGVSTRDAGEGCPYRLFTSGRCLPLTLGGHSRGAQPWNDRVDEVARKGNRA